MDLREMGASLSLDDFGTGYSSLTHIRRYPLRALKIDHSFVAGMDQHAEDRAVIAAVVGMAGALNLSVVGEGVETIEQYEALRALGCSLAQGYLVAHPLRAENLPEWLLTSGDNWQAPSPARGSALSHSSQSV
jgi:EAL domain-containing protein (putative c-di-GMP-specific phosphodiesterase class I)